MSARVRVGDIVRIKVYDYEAQKELGYIRIIQVDDPSHKEWVTEVADPSQAARFQYFGFNERENTQLFNVLGTGSEPRQGPFPTIVEPTSGEYILYQGTGGEFNPLLVGTVEYYFGVPWRVEGDQGLNYGEQYFVQSYEELRMVQKPIITGAHGREIRRTQLRFGILGNPLLITVVFERE